jgi:hypothetical protein
VAFAWFRVDIEVADHPKFHLLDAELREPRTGWYVTRGWCWLARYAARGEFAPELDLAFEAACGWRGEAGELVRALHHVGLLEVHTDGTREWHDWWEKQGAAVEKSIRDADLKRAKRRAAKGLPPEAPRKKRATAARAVLAPGASTPPLRDETVRDETKASSTPHPSFEPSAARSEGLKTQVVEPGKAAPSPQTAPPAANGTGDEAEVDREDESPATARSAVWVMWAEQNGAADRPGQSVYMWASAQFQKYAADDAARSRLTLHLKLAWQDFTGWCAATGKTPGWGLWLQPAVGDHRLDEARAGLLPRKAAPAEQRTMPLGPLGAVGSR